MHVHPHVAISGVAKEVSIPLIALLLGALSRPVPQLRTASLLMIYFGAQTGIMLLAKSIISSAIVSHELDLHGLPAAFLMTAVHQVTTFALFGGAFFVSRFTPWPHIPQPLTSWLEVRLILAFSASFAANIGLNNFSFQFLPLSLNLVIRSCLPIATAFVQALRPHKGSEPVKGTTLQELMYMVLGVICAVVGVVAQTKAVAKAGGEHLVPRNMGLGVLRSDWSFVGFRLAMGPGSFGIGGTGRHKSPENSFVWRQVPGANLNLGVMRICLAILGVCGPGSWTSGALEQAVLDTLKVQSSWPTEGEALAELLRVCQHVLGKGLQAEDFELQSAALVRTSNGKTVPAALITNGYRVSQASPENLLFVPLNQLSPPVLAGEHFLHLRYDGVRLLPSGKYLAVDKCGCCAQFFGKPLLQCKLWIVQFGEPTLPREAKQLQLDFPGATSKYILNDDVQDTMARLQDLVGPADRLHHMQRGMTIQNGHIPSLTLLLAAARET
ncbi:unnamed protein product [Effrenium voratum]|uniref:Uncharacterized protein n=1 Tax=Effrenium voratum TaxID=2562239 RepID=A0AA36JHW6_9DINO|nr:unnamed protein product [Effrenium voratum]